MTRLLTITAVVMFLCGCGKNNEIVYVLANDSYRCEDFEVIKEKMVVLINRARAQSRNCGYKIFTPAGEVAWNPTLARAALDHSVDMATKDFVSHKGSDGSHVDERVEELDYAWTSVGENISAGRETSEEVVAAWLISPEHCENVMRASFTEIGGACFHNKDTKNKTYWTVVFASPDEGALKRANRRE
ncbi:MAG: CAP domain-containing protein [Candidatus Dadabacteria bacterium]|nr:CAP domain-containing protein [Candidatus Dadabacteria bacterium]